MRRVTSRSYGSSGSQSSDVAPGFHSKTSALVDLVLFLNRLLAFPTAVAIGPLIGFTWAL